MGLLIELTVMLCMVGINAIFAAYEIALASVSLARLQRLHTEKKTGSHAALYMKQNMEASLAVVQLGITLVGTIAAAVGGAGAEEKIAPLLVEHLGVSSGTAEFLALTCMVIPLTMTTILLGELIPKVFALRNSERVCLKLSPALRLFSFSVWPIVWFFETVVQRVMSWGERRMGADGNTMSESAALQELRATASLARASRLIGHREENIILGASALASRPVREIMLGVDHISTLDVNASLTENLIAAHLDMHTRFPVVERKGDPQSIIGYVNVKDMIAVMHLSPEEPTLHSIVRALLSLKQEQPIADCLEQLMRDHHHIALIRDADNRIAGMISLEDILEELVGDIGDEFDNLSAHAVKSGKGWIIGGGIPLVQLQEVTGINCALPEGLDAHNFADWVTIRLGRPAKGGDTFEHNGYRILIRKVRRQKVLEAQVNLVPRP